MRHFLIPLLLTSVVATPAAAQNDPTRSWSPDRRDDGANPSEEDGRRRRDRPREVDAAISPERGPFVHPRQARMMPEDRASPERNVRRQPESEQTRAPAGWQAPPPTQSVRPRDNRWQDGRQDSFETRRIERASRWPERRVETTEPTPQPGLTPPTEPSAVRRDDRRDDRRTQNWDRDARRDRDTRWRRDDHWQRDRDAWRDDDRWSRNWRTDRRYDWRHYRNDNRSFYRLPRYRAPYGFRHGYSRLIIGIYLDRLFFSRSYWLNDPWAYRLPPAYGPYRWVRYYDDVLLIDLRNGLVVDVIYDFFW